MNEEQTAGARVDKARHDVSVVTEIRDERYHHGSAVGTVTVFKSNRVVVKRVPLPPVVVILNMDLTRRQLPA